MTNKAEKFLDDMTDDQLKELYKEAERQANEGQKWLGQYCKRNRTDPFEYKNPYWNILYTCKDILGDRAIDD